MKKKAFITGINGQDGSYLSEYLLGLDYEVFGIVRRNSIAEHQESRIDHLVGNGVHTEYGDLSQSNGNYFVYVVVFQVGSYYASSH